MFVDGILQEIYFYANVGTKVEHDDVTKEGAKVVAEARPDQKALMEITAEGSALSSGAMPGGEAEWTGVGGVEGTAKPPKLPKTKEEREKEKAERMAAKTIRETRPQFHFLFLVCRRVFKLQTQTV